VLPRVWLILVSLFLLLGRSWAAEAPASQPLMRDFLGICGHTVQFRPALYAPVCSLVRDYHPVEWDLGSDTAQLPNFPEAKNRVNWQDVYGSWAKAKFRTDACLMFDGLKPERWKDMEADSASYAAAFAKRFGPLGKTPLVEAVEIGNEPGNYTDAQYTALLRAVAPALRKADSRLRIATANLTMGKSTAYAKAVTTLTADGAILPALDVLTIHTYALAEGYPTWRRSFPEDAKLKYLTDVTDLATWRDGHAAGKAIWITEFGYDATTKKPDPKTEFAKWVGVTDAQQAQYLVRSTLVFAALPVERAYIYFFDDNDEPHLHGASGITRHFEPKPAYYALAHLQATLGDYRFSRAVIQRAGELYAYEFVRGDGSGKRVIAAWSPTGSGRQAVAALALPVGMKLDHAERMPLGKEAAVDVKVVSMEALPIDESPLYVFLTPSTTAP